MIRRTFRLAVTTAAFLAAASPVWAARTEERDMDGDGRKEKIFYADNGRIRKVEADKNGDRKTDVWTEYGEDGAPAKTARDLHRKDGKPDTWETYRKGRVYLREFDRNFDGKPDLRMDVDELRVFETHYDDDFDGQFERSAKPPKNATALLKQPAKEAGSRR